MAQDVLRVASHHDAADPASAVSTADDQIRGPGVRLLDDALAGFGAECLDQSSVGVDPGAAHRGERVVEDAFAACNYAESAGSPLAGADVGVLCIKG